MVASTFGDEKSSAPQTMKAPATPSLQEQEQEQGQKPEEVTGGLSAYWVRTRTPATYLLTYPIDCITARHWPGHL